MATPQYNEAEDCVIRISHLRYESDLLTSSGYLRRSGTKPDPKGGLTVVTIHWKGLFGEGRAVCSRRDNYNKRLGRTIALGRAWKNWHLAKAAEAAEHKYAEELNW